MKIVDNAKACWKHYSTIALAMAGSLQGAWLAIPDTIKSDLPPTVGHVVAWIVFGVAVGGLGGKFVDQTKDKP